MHHSTRHTFEVRQCHVSVTEEQGLALPKYTHAVEQIVDLLAWLCDSAVNVAHRACSTAEQHTWYSDAMMVHPSTREMMRSVLTMSRATTASSPW
jgi:hypothetical protein